MTAYTHRQWYGCYRRNRLVVLYVTELNVYYKTIVCLARTLGKYRETRKLQFVSL